MYVQAANMLYETEFMKMFAAGGELGRGEAKIPEGPLSRLRPPLRVAQVTLPRDAFPYVCAPSVYVFMSPPDITA